MKGIAFFPVSFACLTAVVPAAESLRERLLMDFDWRGALGHEPDKFFATKGTPSPEWSRSLFNGLAQIISHRKSCALSATQRPSIARS